ncbi:hypothetical protein [Sphingomonas sp. RS2018]
MTTPIWIVATVASCIVCWWLAAKAGQAVVGRCVVSIAGPFWTMFVVIAWDVLLPAGSEEERKWRVVLLVMAFLMSSGTLLVTLPTWFLLEDKFGWRFR